MKASNPAFDEDSRPILAVDFHYPEEAAESAARTALEILQAGLAEVIHDGHADGVCVRAGALARLCGVYASDQQAAEAVGCHRTTITRAVQRMKARLRTSQTPIDTGDFE